MSPITRILLRRVTPGVAALAAAPLLLTACSGSDDSPAGSRAADVVTIDDQWVKAAAADMSAAFGTLTNSGDRDLTVVAATSPASARMELHEVVADAAGVKTMRPKDGGFVVPAHGSLTLAPGGDHLMFLELRGPLRTGSETPVTLSFGDGSSLTFTAQVRDFSGNQENYAPGTEHGAAATPEHGA
ncbi:copper chaperone PCu(A)C [Nocardia farcinica]|uniref:copper chaperone PCu(A)C n=1 Tax=Nocardia farcinica TaxID=37329 RepID=UPI00245757CC|nr:copper chaperone PCu(A)C [Nocardia farcinica]